jgi:hypothetical protein
VSRFLKTVLNRKRLNTTSKALPCFRWNILLNVRIRVNKDFFENITVH